MGGKLRIIGEERDIFGENGAESLRLKAESFWLSVPEVAGSRQK
jgi:hypothetical protein